MMQSCASVAKLRGGRANLQVGIRASSNHGFPATSDRQFGSAPKTQRERRIAQW